MTKLDFSKVISMRTESDANEFKVRFCMPETTVTVSITFSSVMLYTCDDDLLKLDAFLEEHYESYESYDLLDREFYFERSVNKDFFEIAICKFIDFTLGLK